MFRGSAPAKIDDKGRLKVPTQFRGGLEDSYGRDVFVTSVQGDSALIYPLSIWEEHEARILAKPSSTPAVRRYLQRVNYFGAEATLDAQGRLVIPQILRDKAEMAGEVVVSGNLQHLVVWNRERFEHHLEDDPFTEDDFRALSDLAI